MKMSQKICGIFIDVIFFQQRGKKERLDVPSFYTAILHSFRTGIRG